MRLDRTERGHTARAHPVALLLAAALTACAAHDGGGRTPGPTPAQGPARTTPAYTTPVPGVADTLHGTTVFFTRRLPATGEAVAFAFTPREVTSSGNLVGELRYTGRHATGRVEHVLAALSFSAGTDGACGRVGLQIEPVTLEGLGLRAAFPMVSVDLRDAGGGLGRAAKALCRGADRLLAFLRALDEALAPDGSGRKPGSGDPGR